MHLPLMFTAALSLFAITGVAHAAEPDAARLYHDYCSVCHGDKGDGKSRASGSMNPPPRDFTTPAAATELTRERMIASVTHGVPGTAMSGWKAQLDAAQIAALVDHMRNRFMRPSTTADTHGGRRLYADYCSVCHGDEGNGRSRASGSMNPPPRDFTSTAARAELGRERMLFSVKHGRANTAMAAWGTQLDDAQIDEVVDYIRTAIMGLDAGEPAVAKSTGVQGDGHAHVAVDLGAPLPDGLVGDLASGEAFYRSNCTVCHGDQGDGQGPRAYFINPKPRDFGHSASRASLNLPALYAAIADGVRGSEMPAWRFVLEPQEMANIAEYVFREFILAEVGGGTSATPGHADGAPGHGHAPAGDGAARGN